MTVCPRCGNAAQGSERACRACGSPVPPAVSLVKPVVDPLRTIRLEKPAPAQWSAASPPPPEPGPMIADSVPVIGRSRSSRRAAVAVVVAVVSGVATVAGFAGAIRTVGEAVVAALPGGTAPESAVRPRALEVSATPAAGGAIAAPEVSPTRAPFAAMLSSDALRALLLGPADLPAAAGVAVDPGAGTEVVSLRVYANQYRQAMTPATCERAKGLLLFADASPAVAGGPIVRSDGLLLDGGDGGSQQVRRFATEAGAIDFMQQQRAWFDDCGMTTYRWPGRTIDFDGAVFDDRAPDLLLASATDTDSSTGTHPEFDGWARVGPVVYGAYLTGGVGTDRDGLEQAGRAVLAAAQQRLIAAG